MFQKRHREFGHQAYLSLKGCWAYEGVVLKQSILDDRIFVSFEGCVGPKKRQPGGTRNGGAAGPRGITKTNVPEPPRSYLLHQNLRTVAQELELVFVSEKGHVLRGGAGLT